MRKFKYQGEIWTEDMVINSAKLLDMDVEEYIGFMKTGGMEEIIETTPTAGGHMDPTAVKNLMTKPKWQDNTEVTERDILNIKSHLEGFSYNDEIETRLIEGGKDPNTVINFLSSNRFDKTNFKHSTGVYTGKEIKELAEDQDMGLLDYWSQYGQHFDSKSAGNHAPLNGFLESTGPFLGSDNVSAVDFLNNAYGDQMFNGQTVRFNAPQFQTQSKDEELPGDIEVLIGDQQEGEGYYFDLAFTDEGNKDVYQQITNHIDNFTKNIKQDENFDNILPDLQTVFDGNLPERLMGEDGVASISGLDKDGIVTEDGLRLSLNKLLENLDPKWKVEQFGVGHNIRLTSPGGISHDFNLESLRQLQKNKETLKKVYGNEKVDKAILAEQNRIINWIKRNPSKRKEVISQEKEFKNFLTEEGGMFHGDNWKEITSNEFLRGVEDDNDFVAKLRRDFGYTWQDKLTQKVFNEEGRGYSKRINFSELSQYQMESIIAETFHAKVFEERERYFNNLIKDQVAKMQEAFEKGDTYDYEGNKVSSFNDFFKIVREDIIQTFSDPNEKKLATANMQLQYNRQNLSADQIAMYEEDQRIAISALDHYTQFYNPETGERINAPKSRMSEFEAMGFADNGDNVETAKEEIQDELLTYRTNNPEKTDLEVLEYNFEKNTLAEVNFTNTYEKGLVPYFMSEGDANALLRGWGPAKDYLDVIRVAPGWSGINGTTLSMEDMDGITEGNTVANWDQKDDNWVEKRNLFREKSVIMMPPLLAIKLKNTMLGEFEEAKILGYGKVALQRGDNQDEINNGYSVLKQDWEKLQDRKEGFKSLYLLNEDMTTIGDKDEGYWGSWVGGEEGVSSTLWGNAGAQTVIGLGVGADTYKSLWGMTEMGKIDNAGVLMGDLNFELTGDQKNYQYRALGQTTFEGFTGSAGILLEFAVANKFTAAARGLKIFKGSKNLNTILSGWKAKRYSNGRMVLTEAQIAARAAKMGISPQAYQLRYGAKLADGTRKFIPLGVNRLRYGSAMLTESTIEGLKFVGIGGENFLGMGEGDTFGGWGEFAVGFGFGAAGQVLGPIMGNITPKTFKGLPITPKVKHWLTQQSPRLNKIYNLGFKNPTNFVVGSEMGELVHGFAEEVLKNNGAFRDYVDHHWAEYSEPSKRLLSNYMIGIGFGFTHKANYGKKIGGKWRWFPDFRSLDGIKRSMAEAESKLHKVLDRNTFVVETKDGKIEEISREQWNNRKQGKDKGWKILKQPGQKVPLNVYLKSGLGNEAIRDQYVKNLDTYNVFRTMYETAKGQYEMMDPIMGQYRLEKTYRDQVKHWEKQGWKVNIKWGTNETMGEKGFIEVKDSKNKTMDMQFNVEKISLGIAPHEMGHAGTIMLFGENFRFKGDFMQKLWKLSEKIELEDLHLDGPKKGNFMTLADAMQVKNKKWSREYGSWEAGKVSEWEMFMYMAEVLAKPSNFIKLRSQFTYGKLADLVNNTIGKELNQKYDFKVDADIVRFFGDYIQSINKGKNSLEVLKHLEDVVLKPEDAKGESERAMWEKEGFVFDRAGVTKTVTVRSTELVNRNKELASKHFKEGKWENKKAETEFKSNVEEIRRQKNLAEQVIRRKDGKIGYEENRSNEDIAGENTRIVTTVNALLKQNKVDRIKDLPEGPIKDAIITNLLNNNIGVVNKLAGKAQKTALKDKNVPKEQVPSNENFVQEYTLEALKLIKNYNPKKNPEFGAYLQNKKTGLPVKYGTILKSLLKGQVKGKADLGKADIETKATYQKDFDLVSERGENVNRIDWTRELFTTGEIKTDIKTGIKTEVVNVKKQKEVYKEISEAFDKLTAEQIGELNYTNIRDFWKVFSGEKPHVIFTALSKNIIDNIAGKSPKEKAQFVGSRLETLYKLMGETNQVLMSGVKAEKGIKGGEGRSIQIRAELLNLFYKETQRTTDDATGSSITIQEKLPFNKQSVLDKLGIETIREKVPNERGDGYDIAERFQLKKDLTASQKLNINRFLQEIGRNLVAKRGVEWIKTNYKNNPELAAKLTEGQIIGRLSGGASKYFSERLGRQTAENQREFYDQIVTERFGRLLNRYRPDGEKGVIKAIREHFKHHSISNKHTISNADLREIAKDLYKEFRNADYVSRDMIKMKAFQAIEFATKLENITARSVKDGVKFDGKYEFGEGIERQQFTSKENIKRLIKEYGVGVEDLLITGESGGRGVGMFRSLADALLGRNQVKNRFAFYETAGSFKEMTKEALKELKKEAKQEGHENFGWKEFKYKGFKGRSSDITGKKEAMLELATKEGGKLWDIDAIVESNKIADGNKQVLRSSIENLREMYKNELIDHNQVRAQLEMYFGNMSAIGKKSAGLALVPNMSPREMFKIWGSEAKNFVLEHIIPAQYLKARAYDYVLNGEGKKEALELTLRDFATTFIPGKGGGTRNLDKMVNELAKDNLPSTHLPGMDVMMRYYKMFHSSDFNFGLRNVMYGKNSFMETYDFHPNMSNKQKMLEFQKLSNQYNKVFKKLGFGKHGYKLNSEKLSRLEDIDAAWRAANMFGKRRGMSTWDFDDTLATTKSGVRARIPNPEGTPKPSRKVIFLAGGAGSGKSNVVKKLGLEKDGFKIVNQDISLEWLKKNHGLPENMNDLTKEQKSTLGKLGHQARTIARRKMMKFQGNAEGVVVDGTGGSMKSMEKLVKEFKEKGYDVSMLFVETSLPVALARNRARAERSLLDKIVERNHEAVQGNKEGFKKMFGERFMEVNTDKLKQKDAMPSELVNKMNDFVRSYEKVRLDAEQFATEGKSILDKGGKFDFSEFNVVTEGAKGPFFQKALNRAKKFGTEHQYVLTARPPEAQIPIYEFLKSQGLKIPLENITGLGNSTGEAKALWMLKKFAEGYNDMYFADDAIQNVKAVRDVLNQLDVKSKVEQAKRYKSENLGREFNEIVERSYGVDAKKTYSEAKARLVGSKAVSWLKRNSLHQPGAEDFAGLTAYTFAGKGKKGEADLKWFEENLHKVYDRAWKDIHSRKQNIYYDYKALRKEFSDVKKRLNDQIPESGYTVENAIRVYNWNKSGFEIPGLSKTDLRRLDNFVKSDANLLAFAENLRSITRLKEGYLKPGRDWLGENITIDMNNVVDRSYKDQALTKFKKNREIIFGKWENGRLVGPNMNKIEAIRGSKHREALENMLWRMENLTNRTIGKDRIANAWLNWVNNATGTIMFFNQKSAALQTISTLNYVNGSFNNPLKAGMAFANQKQYWADFAKIFNSDMLLQRRMGLKINIEANELVERVGSGKNKASAALAYLLQKGFIPTKYADSFAIASGGATYYRNAIKKYKKQGLSEKEAETKAWEDFMQITEATQQSSRPDFISMQQASAVGRPILAFANTPMQMFRRHKRRLQDIINNRGNKFENIASALYYGFAQTIVFSYLSNAMFAVDDESDDPKKIKHAEKQKSRHVHTVADSYLRGMGTPGAVVSALKNGIIRAANESGKKMPDYGNVVVDMLNVSPPIGSKVRKLYQSGKTFAYNREEIWEMGWDWDNPAVLASANTISATTNIPVDRAVMKVNNLRDASNNDFETWQRISFFMGLNKWALGIDGISKSDTKLERVEKKIKKDKKIQSIIKREKKKGNTITEQDAINIQKGSQIRKLNKEHQRRILKGLNYDGWQILQLKKEQDRIDEIIKLWKENPSVIDSILNVPLDQLPALR